MIALGRVMLAAMFLAAIWFDPSQPSESAGQTYAFLFFYLCFALGLAAITWTNWWLDARLAAAAHVVDMIVFGVIVFSTNGYTSPFFLVFILPLLSAAIRWGWRETALTALALVVLYFAGGLFVAGSISFELQRFIVRTGHLIILSAILIWFGIHQRLTGPIVRLDEFDSIIGQDDAEELAVRVAMETTGARAGAILLSPGPHKMFSGLLVEPESMRMLTARGPLVRDLSFGRALLFNVGQDRALGRTARSWAKFGRASTVLDAAELEGLGFVTGLVVRLRCGTGEGWLVLDRIPDLSTDYIGLGGELGRAAGAALDRSALVAAIEESVAAQTRLTLARDVHDSIVQFLAGATFRVEAIARAARSGADVEPDLKDLKGLLVEEQRDLRGFVTALRRDRELQLEESVDELRALAERLGQQWSVKCSVKANGKHAPIPIRLQLDLEQLLREAVANAVRHGGASKVDVSLAVDGDQLHFDVRDNGSGFAAVNGGSPVEPWSLRERVDRANGSLLLVSTRGRTDISISLPLSGVSA